MFGSLLLSLAALGAPQPLHVMPPDCRDPALRGDGERTGPDLAPFAAFETCAPLGADGRHVYIYHGFAGEVVSFHVAPIETQSYFGAPPELALAISGPDGFAAEAPTQDPHELRVALPAHGAYRVTVRRRDPRAMDPGGYRIATTEHEALPAPDGDCSRYALPGGYVAIDMEPRPVAAGGVVRLRPLWGRHGRSYDVPFQCLSDWRVAPGFARLSEDRRTLHIGPAAPVGARVEVNATIGSERLASFVDVAPPPEAP